MKMSSIMRRWDVKNRKSVAYFTSAADLARAAARVKDIRVQVEEKLILQSDAIRVDRMNATAEPLLISPTRRKIFNLLHSAVAVHSLKDRKSRNYVLRRWMGPQPLRRGGRQTLSWGATRKELHLLNELGIAGAYSASQDGHHVSAD